jgi:P27 family predicted phage terminase small subunit
MPRKSAASLSVVRVDGRPERLKAPAGLGAAERAVWLALVGACQPEHFTKSDVPLLAAYCSAVVLERQAAQHLSVEGPVLPGNKVNPWLTVQEKQIKAIVSLSMRLRLSPQARLRRETTKPESGLPKPWDSAYLRKPWDDPAYGDEEDD